MSRRRPEMAVPGVERAFVAPVARRAGCERGWLGWEGMGWSCRRGEGVKVGDRGCGGEVIAARMGGLLAK